MVSDSAGQYVPAAVAAANVCSCVSQCLHACVCGVQMLHTQISSSWCLVLCVFLATPPTLTLGSQAFPWGPSIRG